MENNERKEQREPRMENGHPVCERCQETAEEVKFHDEQIYLCACCLQRFGVSLLKEKL